MYKHLTLVMMLSASMLNGQSLQDSIGSLLRITEQQASLTQLMAKDYLLKTYDAYSSQANNELNDAINNFEHNLGVIKQAFKNDEHLKESLTKEEAMWFMYRRILQKETTPDHISYILEQNNNVLLACRQVAEDVSKYANTRFSSSGKDARESLEIISKIQLCSLQEMLFERFGFYMIASSKKIQTEQTNTNMELAIQELGEKNMLLIRSRMENPEVTRALEDIYKDWLQLRELYSKKSISPEALATVGKDLENSLRKAGSLYAEFLNHKQ